jgi:hypothetical protein
MISNAPESAYLTREESEEMEVGREALISLRKTFYTWLNVCRAVRTLRRKADEIGDRSAFKRLLVQQGFGPEQINAATVSIMLAIMDNEAEVVAWHAKLPEKKQREIASPSAVRKYCPIINVKLANKLAGKDDAEPRQSPVAKLRQAYDELVEEADRVKAHAAELEASRETFDEPEIVREARLLLYQLYEVGGDEAVRDAIRSLESKLRFASGLSDVVSAFTEAAKPDGDAQPKRRGRPPGSKNKPKARPDSDSEEVGEELASGARLSQVATPKNGLVWGRGTGAYNTTVYIAEAGERGYRVKPYHNNGWNKPPTGYYVERYSRANPAGASLGKARTVPKAKAIAQKHFEEAEA